MTRSFQRTLSTYVALLALTIAYPTFLGVRTVAQPATKTIWEGVYTKEQAARGQETYDQRCGFCHRSDLSGGKVGDEVAPAIGGPTFPVRWRGPLSELFFKIADEMPKDNPGSLSANAVADVVSFLLFANEAPRGDVELSSDPEQLKAILVTRKPQ